VGETALGAAMMRAEERTCTDRLFDDPYAAAFVAAAPDAFADGPDPGEPGIAELRAAFQTKMAIRTRFYDDYLRTACVEGCRQVVLVAAGLDVRAFRLDWPPGVRLFELDLPEVLSFKDTVLANQRATPRCSRVGVRVDLREDWPVALTKAGYDLNVPTAWTAEGLLTYLSHDTAASLLTRITDLSRAGSQLALETARIADDSTLTEASAVPALEQVSTLWEGGLHDDATQWLRGRGWEVEEHDRATLAASYHRPISDTSTGGYLTATRRG
jgi:methyltransferase (TIGR00027 family)